MSSAVAQYPVRVVVVEFDVVGAGFLALGVDARASQLSFVEDGLFGFQCLEFQIIGRVC